MTKTEACEDARRKLHAAILVVVKADGKPPINDGTRVAIKSDSFARPHFTVDGIIQPQRTGGVLCLPLAMYGGRVGGAGRVGTVDGVGRVKCGTSVAM